MRKIMLCCLLLAVASCKSYDASTFSVGDVDYASLKKNPAVSELRIYEYMTNSAQNCLFEKSAEGLVATAAVSAIGYVGKELIAYGKSELEKRAAYLESDVVVSGKALRGTQWPDSKNDTNNALCLLIVVGEFGQDPDPSVASNFQKGVFPTLDEDTFMEGMNKYKISTPGGSSEDINPFASLNEDPSFMLEVKVVSAKLSTGDKWQYYLTPTYLFYPKPLHMMSKTGLSRSLSVELGVGDAKGSIDLDRLKSGSTYTQSLLKQRFSVTDEKGAAASNAITAKVTEGPDRMPTAKALKAVASKDEALLSWLDERLKELEEKMSK
jgi:hypothetical protein